MLYKDIDLMTNGQWINYREDLIEDFYSRGFVLKPSIDCSICDSEDDYTCFDCECTQLNSERV
jgi:hypothetical protein